MIKFDEISNCILKSIPKQNRSFVQKQLNKLDDNSLDCIITSPPYNFGKDYNTYDDKIDFKVYEDWLKQIFELCSKKLKEGGRMFVNVLVRTSLHIMLLVKYYRIVDSLGVEKYYGRKTIITVHIPLGVLGVVQVCLISNILGSLLNTSIKALQSILVIKKILIL